MKQSGTVNPCGKLAETFPKKQRQDVDFGEGMRVCYKEGLEVGYRYYDRHVVQVYTGQNSPVMSRPVKELKVFEKVYLEAGQEKQLEMTIPVRELGYYNVMLGDWVVENDLYRIFVGASSRDIRLEMEVRTSGNMIYSVRRTGEASVG